MEKQFQKINYNFKTKRHGNLLKLNKKNHKKPKGYILKHIKIKLKLYMRTQQNKGS